MQIYSLVTNAINHETILTTDIPAAL